MFRRNFVPVAVVLLAATTVSSALSDGLKFSTLYAFEPAAPVTFTSPLGSQPFTRPVVGPGNTVYGMTSVGGKNGNGVIYRFDLRSHRYTLLHTFSATNPSTGANEEGAIPGVALTRGPDHVFYGVTQFGGANGNGTVFKITDCGEFRVLHTFSAVDASFHNEDGANPLRTVIIGRDGNLYGTTRVGGKNTCDGTRGCDVAWRMDPYGKSFTVLHQFTASEGHAGSVIQDRDGLLYGSAVYPFTSLPSGAPLPSGTLFRMTTSGQEFQVLYRFTQTNANGANPDGADPYEPLLETESGVFYGAAYYGEANGTGVVFRYSLSKPNSVEVLHTFSPVNSSGENWDGANPYARLTLGHDGAMYSTAIDGGENGNGVVYRICSDGNFDVLHDFSATNPKTGANRDGAGPAFGVVLYDRTLIGVAVVGGKGSSAGINNTGGTLYELRLDELVEDQPY